MKIYKSIILVFNLWNVSRNPLFFFQLVTNILPNHIKNDLWNFDWFYDFPFLNILIEPSVRVSFSTKLQAQNTWTRDSFLIKLLANSFIKNFYEKENLSQVFSCDYINIFKNTFFEEHLQTAKTFNYWTLPTSKRALRRSCCKNCDLKFIFLLQSFLLLMLGLVIVFYFV